MVDDEAMIISELTVNTNRGNYVGTSSGFIGSVLNGVVLVWLVMVRAGS